MALAAFHSAAFSTQSGVAVAANADIEVRLESTGNLATIYEDRDGNTAITQPGFQADSSGRFEFFAAGGAYRITVDDGVNSYTLNYVAIGTAAENDAGATGVASMAATTALEGRQAIDAVGLSGVTSRSSNTILDADDSGGAFVATASFTQTFDDVATLGDKWHVHYRVNSGVTITFDPDTTEQIDGAATKAVVGPASGYIVCNGSALFTYGFDGPAASDTVAGRIEIATQAEQEAGSDATRAVTPGRQHFHPSAAKARVTVTGGGTPAIAEDYGVSSVGDNGSGDYTINFDTAFSSINYTFSGFVQDDGTSHPYVSGKVGVPPVVGSCRLAVCNGANAALDTSDRWGVIFFGDQ